MKKSHNYPHKWVDDAVRRARWDGLFFGFVAGAFVASAVSFLITYYGK